MRVPVALAACLVVTALHAAPVSQWNGGGVGPLQMFHEPLVELTAVEAQIRIRGDDADIRLRHHLIARAGARHVTAQLPGVVFPTELDGAALPASPLIDVKWLADGMELKAGETVKSVLRADVCGDSVDGLSRHAPHLGLSRAAFSVRADKATVLELAFRTRLTHDDWRRGTVERSARSLCVRLGVGNTFLGVAKGRASVHVRVDRSGDEVTITPATPTAEGQYRWSATDVDLRGLPDVVVTIAAPRR